MRTDAGPDDSDGGVDGGPPVLCAEGCHAWQTCKPTSIANGVCVNANIKALSPQENARFTGGNPATFVFEVTQWDGGMWPGEVPFTTSPGMTGPTVLSRRASTFEAQVTLANVAGTQSVTAGWGAVDAGVTVVTEKCNLACSAFEECVADATGGACVDMGLTLAFTAPTVGQEYGPINSGAVPLSVTVSRADGGPFVAPIPFTLSMGGGLRAQGLLSKSGNLWTASVDAGADDGTRTLFAGWDGGGPSTTSSFKVTASPPTLTLVAETAPLRPANQTDSDGVRRWKKSEVAPVKLVSNRDLLTAPTAGDFTNPSVAAAVSSRCGVCEAPRCYCFEVDLGPQAFVQRAQGSLEGTVSVSLNKSLTDALGNSGAAAPVGVDATRFKWKQNIASGAAPTPIGLALTPAGVVVAGVTTAGAVGTLTALHPDGGVAWQRTYSTEAVTAGPMVGEKGIYFAVTPTPTYGVLRRVDFNGANDTNRCGISGLTYVGDMALASPGDGEYPIAVASDGTLKGGTKATDSDCHASAPLAGGALGASDRPTVIIEGGTSYVALSSQPPIWKFGNLDATPVDQGSRTTSTLFPSNLFSDGTGIVGGGGPTVGGVFSFFDDGATLDGGATVNATPGTKPGGAAVVGADGGDGRLRVYYGDSGGNLRHVRLSAEDPPSFSDASFALGAGSLSTVAPIVGAGGHLYAAAIGRVQVFDDTPAPEWHWNVPNAPAEALVGQLNLDKNRDAASPCAAGQPGVLYVVTTQAPEAYVYAILVDSQGVEAGARWPRFQHNPANTGNRATGLGPWVCP